jgi:hypothetical protein
MAASSPPHPVLGRINLATSKSIKKFAGSNEYHPGDRSQFQQVVVTRYDEIRTADLGGLDELVIVWIVRNSPDSAGNLDNVGRGPDELNHIISLDWRVPKLDHKDGMQLIENGWG